MRILVKCLCLVLIFSVTQCGDKKEEKIAGNYAPVISSVTLLPLNPTVQSEITARILSSDKDGDPITYKVKWFVNNQEIGEGMSFKFEDIKKGDMVFAEVTPYDGKAWGKPVRSGGLAIGGLPPKIVSLSIVPEVIFATTPQVMVNAMFEDPDNDTISLVIHWLVKDNVLSDTSNILQLQRYDLNKNDVVTGAAFADDGEFRSEPFNFELIVANSPPAFKTKTDSIKCAPDSIYYPLPIFDPDNDPLTFEILDAPKGINVDPEKGIVYGSAGDLKAFDILVRATDTDGAYLDAKFTLTSP